MQLIFINRFFYPDHSATSQMLSDLAFALAREGRSVTVVTSRLIYDDESRMLPAAETVMGVRIVRVRTTRFGRAGLPGRAIDYLTFYLSAAWALLRLVRRGDVVIAKTDPPMLSVIAAPIARLKGARLVNWLQDVFPEVAVALGVGTSRLSRLGYAALTSWRNRSLRRAKLNIVLGTRMDERLAAAGVPASKRRIIPNWADGQIIHPVDHALNPLRKAWGLNNAFVVAYSGNLGRAHDMATFLEAIETIERQRGEAKGALQRAAAGGGRRVRIAAEPVPIAWLFIGGGAQLAGLRSEVERRGLSSVRFEPYQPREKLAQSLSAADLHLISLRPELEGLIVPSKYYGIAAAGRPCVFIGDADGEIPRILAETQTGLTVPQGNGAELATAILHLASAPAPCRQMGARARQVFAREFDVSVGVDRWRSALHDVLEARR